MFKGRSKASQGEEDDGDHGYFETDPTGRYARCKEVLGKGAMKTVYKAVDELLGMEVAWSQVKLNDLLYTPEDLQRLYSEVHLLSTLNHDSIIKFYTSWIDVDRRTFNFITEMFTSGTLREFRGKYQRVHMLAIKIWARQILSGLVYLHGHDPPVIHRDLKCDNIFVNGHLGQVKIGDLGLAAILRQSCRAHSVIGTPEFMAPELYEENYNELVDVYSFGMCMLEMLTQEYPYSECTNPAQIYKKVTSGKLPRAFYKVQDLEALRFIGKCLVASSKRLSAKELLQEPFLAKGEVPMSGLGLQKSFLNDDVRIDELGLDDYTPRANMTITGKLNPEDDTIFLKVQIANKEGSMRNIYFPFDILSDTPDDVAVEMVKELELGDWDPSDIADMIGGEVSALVPYWERGQSYLEKCSSLNHQEDDDQHCYLADSFSSCSSSQMSFSGLLTSHRRDEKAHGYDWLQDDLYDDTSSQGSIVSGTYSNMSYYSAEDRDCLFSLSKGSLHPNSTRFSHVEKGSLVHLTAKNCRNQPMVVPDLQGALKAKSKRGVERVKPMKNRSLVDMRSQLLHRSLVEEVSKRRLSKTAGDVEDVGFQSPYKREGHKGKRA